MLIVNMLARYRGEPDFGFIQVLDGLAQAYRTRIKNAVNVKELGLNGMRVRCLQTNAKLPQWTANTILHQLLVSEAK
ncbi:MAG: hypothetical protein ABJV04_19975 [Aliiglaciecola sp.]|uniref:hypothetical protein n=1 Tax=Aliiglaciecola sp. TaxID=1872441 RepID=UPI00329717F4